VWRVLNRLRHSVSDPIARMLLGQPLVPTERDYRFSTSIVAEAPVLVAVCHVT
jgi:hypothetical protein